MLLAEIELAGSPVRVMAADDGAQLAGDVLGVDVTRRRIGGAEHTVVQVLLDDDRPAFDRALYDAPVLVDVVGRDGELVGRELLDHDRFRRALRDERDAGVDERRGVLLLTDGALPERWVRLAFVPVPLVATAGASLRLRRTTVDDLVAGVEQATLDGVMTDAERSTVLTTIDQLHPQQG